MEANAAQAVRAIRNDRGLTQQALAEKAGLAYRTVSVIENGGRVKRRTLQQIADALQVPLEDLLAGSAEAAS